jgi:colanic acid biosynthesis glycosyl transferase WcaI
MRILVVGINYAPDLIGVAKYNTELCEALVSSGHEVRMVTAPPYYPAWSIPRGHRRWRYSAETINGVSVTRAPIYVPSNPSGPKRLLHHASFALSSWWPVLTAATRWRPEVVFAVAPSLMSAAFPALIAKRIGALSWLHLQDFEVDAAFDLGLLNNKRLRAPMIAAERSILRSFDCVSTISPQMLHRLASKGVERRKIRDIRNWTDTRQIVPGTVNAQFRKEQLNVDPAHFVCLYSGTMSNKQGLELILSAAKSLDHPKSNVRFVLCGEGPHKQTLKSLAADLSNVQFLHLQKDDSFAELLKSADVHLIPQKAEAADLVLPSKLGGILASARPVIVMANPNTGLFDEVGKGGIVIPPADTRALATAISRLAEDPSLCCSLGTEARAIALARWDKTTILTALERTLASLIAARSSGMAVDARVARVTAED